MIGFIFRELSVQGKGLYTEKHKIHSINAFEDMNFCRGSADNKNKLKLPNQERILECYEMQGQEGHRG